MDGWVLWRVCGIPAPRGRSPDSPNPRLWCLSTPFQLLACPDNSKSVEYNILAKYNILAGYLLPLPLPPSLSLRSPRMSSTVKIFRPFNRALCPTAVLQPRTYRMSQRLRRPQPSESDEAESGVGSNHLANLDVVGLPLY